MNDKNEIKEKQRVRKKRISFRVDEDELKFIQAKMKMLRIKNREAYLRKMAIDGQCIRYDYSEFESEIRKNNYLMSNAAKSINQIAKRVNSTGNFYGEDLQDLKNQVDLLQKKQVEIMKLFMKETEEK
ncbi:MAG: plasmid mobilization relaxosome protein MobC [Alistipes sp.]|nr:plasmid mobilization relaxosome protein MobC [Alistipes sp.]